MFSNHQKVAGHLPPGPTYGDTPAFTSSCKLKPSCPPLCPSRVNKAKLRKNGPQHMKATTITVAEIFAVLNSSLYWKNWYTLEALLDTFTLSLRAAWKKYGKNLFFIQDGHSMLYSKVEECFIYCIKKPNLQCLFLFGIKFYLNSSLYQKNWYLHT